MLRKIKTIKLINNRIHFQVTEDLLRQDFYKIFSISKSKIKLYSIIPDHNILVKNTKYTIQLHKEDITHTIDKEIKILYEDDICLIVNKPCDLLVHNDGNQSDNLTARVNYYLQSIHASFNAHAIHRIDKDTSGAVFFCKIPFFQSFFDRQIEDHTIKKEYLAIVKGNFKYQKKTIHAPISRDRHNAKKMIIHKNGKQAISHVTKIKSQDGFTLLNIKIETGRKHQIRVHLASIGYPIINDELYGTVIDSRKLCLQSHKLSFIDPITKKTIEVIAPMDNRFKPFC